MKKPIPCPKLFLVEKHFLGKIKPDLEQAMRRHLPNCPECQASYQRHLCLAKLDPKILDAKTRLAFGLGIQKTRETKGWVLTLAWASTLAAVVLLFFWWSNWDSGNQGFVSRGREIAENKPGLLVYRIPLGEKAQLVKDEISSGDELAFAYENPNAYQYLMILGIDEKNKVYWYFPAWLNSKENPESIAIDKSPGIHELQEAVLHQLDSSRLRIVGIFTNRPLSVLEVESQIKGKQGLTAKLQFKDAVLLSTVLEVRP